MKPFRNLVLAWACGAGVFAATPAAARANHWHGTWGAAPHMPLSRMSDVSVPDLRDKSIRQIVRISAGGNRIRLRLSNELSAQDHAIGNITVALALPNGAIRTETLREVTFGGLRGATLGVGAPLLSDPIDLKVAAGADLAITIYFPDAASDLTGHGSAYATAWVLDGDQTQAIDFSAGRTFMRRVVMSGVDVLADRKNPVIVALGDSITDGTRSSVDANRRWPDRLAERLRAAGKAKVAVVNAGIGGNRVLRKSQSPSALARFDRDVLAVPGASHLIVLEGVNDLGSMQREGHAVSARDLINGYRQIIRRAHSHDMKVFLATILPYKGAGYWSEEGERVRREVNAWIRSQAEADGIFDFDRAIADPAEPEHMAKPYDIGDSLHPNDAGMEVIAAAVDLRALLAPD